MQDSTTSWPEFYTDLEFIIWNWKLKMIFSYRRFRCSWSISIIETPSNNPSFFLRFTWLSIVKWILLIRTENKTSWIDSFHLFDFYCGFRLDKVALVRYLNDIWDIQMMNRLWIYFYARILGKSTIIFMMWISLYFYIFI